MSLIKSRASLDRLVVAPYVNSPRGAVCLTCGRIVDYEGVVEGYPAGPLTWETTEPDEDGCTSVPIGNPEHAPTTWCKYLVKHHGAEELRTFDMRSANWTYADAAALAARTNWFVPNEHEGLALGTTVVLPGDHDEVDD